MAIQIPTLSGPSVRSRPIGTPRAQAQPVDTSMSELGQQAIGAASKIFQKSMEDADNAALIDAEAKLSNWKLNTMFNPQGGVYTRKGSNALDITNQTLPQFDEQANSIGSALTNERQRSRWNQIVANQRQGLNGELNRYEFGERQRFYDETDKASLDAATAGATAYYQDPEQIAYYQNKGVRIIAANGQRKGLPAEAIEQNARAFNSGVATSVIQRMAAEDPLKAQQYYATAYDYMTPDDQLRVTKLLGTAVRQQMGAQIGTSLWAGGSLGDSGLPALIMQAESGGDPGAVSPKGAKGLMQLMPETAKEMAAELGMPYSEERLTSDPNYNMALGNAYINKMLGRYTGNTTLAVAAYNAGPGRVDEWVEKYGDPRKGEITEQEFIDKIPFEETRDYTQKITQQMAGTVPAARRYADAVGQVNKIQDPQLRKYAQDKLDDLKKAQDLEDKANYDEAAEVVMDRGYNAIPPQMLDTLSADDQLKLQKMDDYRRRGTEPETDYTKLQEFISMPPAQLAELSLDRDIRPYLNNADFNRVVTAYQKAATGDTSGQGALKAEENSLRMVMNMAGILTGDSKDAKAPKNLAKQQQFRAAYQARLDQANDANLKAKQNGGAVIPVVPEQIAQQLLLDVRLSGTGIVSDSSRQLWEVAPEELERAYLDRGDLAISDIAPGERLRTVQTLRATGQSAGEADIIAAYIEKISGLGVTVR